MTINAHTEESSVRITQMTRHEWVETVNKSLDELGLSFDQLAEEARTRDFSSDDAHKVWVMTGGQRP